MSRRKQAKPRAFLKLGESGECPEEEQAQLLQQGRDVDLLDPKEEILSANDDEEHSCDEANDDNDNEGDEDECRGQQQTEQPQQKHPHVADKTNNGSNRSNRTGSTAKNCNNNKQSSSSNNNDNVILNDTTLVAAVPADRKLRVFGQNVAVLNAEGHIDSRVNEYFDDEGEIDEDDAYEAVDDIDDDEEDLHSLDSYYSDMYSTHTSSSYSPSISDGTMTPNSLQHLHHLHQQHPHHHQHQHLQLHSHHMQQPSHDTESASTRGQRFDNGNVVTAEGEGAVTVHVVDNENTNGVVDVVDKKVHINGAVESTTTAATAVQRNRLGRCRTTGLAHAMKIPTKLRKIDRDAAKFDKLTSEGIKSAAADGSYQCQFCDKSFPRLGYLKKHEQSHAEHLPFKCDYCARLFKHKRSRDRHTKLHTGDRRYRCPHCEAAFSRSDHLKIHMKTHDNQKPFQCTICNRGYNTAAALTSHMQNHKKQAAILAAGGNPQAINYSPRSTGSASSNGSLHKRRYAMTLASDSSPSRLEYPKRLRSTFLSCTYCTKNDFISLEQLNSHIQTMHEKTSTELSPTTAATPTPNVVDAFQMSCEYCTMKFPNIPAMFQHMRTTHIDRLTSPNSYFEHFNRLAATGTFSPRLPQSAAKTPQHSSAAEEHSIKLEQSLSPKSSHDVKQEEPTDLSQNKRRSETPQASPKISSPRTPEKPGVFFCNQCNAGLPDFESFRNHLKTHIAQGLNLVCHHCGMSLRDQSEYERHIVSHFLINNSEFNCLGNNCGNKAYNKSEELQKHLIDQHVVTMYKCALCAELFDSKVAIQVHFACAHTPETKLLRCSACMEVFRTEHDFTVHVKTRHQAANGTATHANNQSSLQCMFCRTVCSSDLEMHFHLAAHARQFRCPSCPETFHVEFLLDRHMQSHHGGNERQQLQSQSKDNYEQHSPVANATAAGVGNSSNNQLSPMNSLYVNALFGKSPLLQQNNNNSMIDYNVAFAAHLNKGLFPAAAAAAATTGKFYSPLQVDTSTMKHPALMYGLGQRYFDTNRTLIDMYNHHQQQDKNTQQVPNTSTYFISPKHVAPTQSNIENAANTRKTPNDSGAVLHAGFSCGMCERNDFRTETEVHSHRKIVHNLKTGVSLRCAYCSGNFKSRSELEHHMKTCHNSTGKHKCLICDEIFPSPAILAEHKLQHSKVGQSGKCSHCAKPLSDVAAFKAHLGEHNTEGQMPVQCICCRQSLHSEFEIGLHAKFHTKSSSMPEIVCALCLESIPNTSNPDTAKVCEKCCRKHNLNNKYTNQRKDVYERSNSITNEPMPSYIENRCNLCKIILPHPQKLQEHLVEHTFAGCEDRGFNCYICSAVFTAPAGLLNHMHEHGQNARPYDCNLCTEKYYFRAELDHHLVDHEQRAVPNIEKEPKPATPEINNELRAEISKESHVLDDEETVHNLTRTATVKKEIFDEHTKAEAGEEDDEYIEVEKVVEKVSTNNKHDMSPVNKTEQAAETD